MRLIPCTIGLPPDDLAMLRELADQEPSSYGYATGYRRPTYAHLIRQLVREHLDSVAAQAKRRRPKVATKTKKATKRKAVKR